MACFGFWIEVPNENQMEKDLVKTGSLKKKKKKSPWISWPRFRPIKSGAKTVPVDISLSGNLDPNARILSFKPHKNTSSKKLTQSNGVNATNKSHQKSMGTVEDEISEINYDEKKHSIRKTETRKIESNKPSSPPENKYISDGATRSPRSRKKLHTVDDKVNVNERCVDSIAGMSVIILILVIMLFWGKLCAILCTCAWFYMIPMLKTPVDSNIIVVKNGADFNSGVPDFDSDEYKKKVVLEGLLRRNRRTNIGIF